MAVYTTELDYAQITAEQWFEDVTGLTVSLAPGRQTRSRHDTS